MRDASKVYKHVGEKIDASWEERLCIHAQECIRAKGALIESIDGFKSA